jgi:DNA-binding MarR family transcriptional regulator
MNAPNRLHVLLERIDNLLRQEMRRGGAEGGLLPVQLQALHYLAICNRYSDTPQGVAEYLALTKGTVSQTLKVLESRGLVRKSTDPEDRRVVHLELTAAGRQALEASVPPPLLAAATTRLTARERKELETGLASLLDHLQQANDRRSFGVCRSCRYHRVISPALARCELLGAELSPEDASRICREHRAAA